MLRATCAVVMSLSAAAALALAFPNADEKPAAQQPAPKSEAAAAVAAKSETTEFTLPPGFKVKQRGKYTLYCKTDTAIGTRFKTETCFNDQQMRDYLLALQENKRDIDRIRATCSSVCACGQPGAC